MRYGTAADPRAASRRCSTPGCDRILLLPLYPQYSATTTATANDKAFAALRKMRWQPAVRSVPPYYDDPAYIDALAASIDRHLAALAFKPDMIIASFHGMPQAYLEKGDPYHCHCQKTTRLLREATARPGGRSSPSPSSRASAGPSGCSPIPTKPSQARQQRDAQVVAVIAPAFLADCLETLEEIAIGGPRDFHAAGGRKLRHRAVPQRQPRAASRCWLAGDPARELIGVWA